ncbi:Uncharacterised protein [[Clostridium] sordellii]|uniref:hypothetical protein n=1 Tax=Paraclostridium sordellii TaxID=1505 RepID=UPI0005E1CD5F|nr:hypothetical protein [Paeniclostridium sordellii]CEP45743.1 Uncharacterised protein [[Clostridium] sordellii] [Paeniclostridium sordellii]
MIEIEELEEWEYDDCNGCGELKDLPYEIEGEYFDIKLCSDCYEELKMKLSNNLKGVLS